LGRRRFERLEDAEQETVVRDLKVARNDLFWARETRLRELKREGWKPVFDRDKIGQPQTRCVHYRPFGPAPD